MADYASRLERVTHELTGQPAAEQPWTARRAAFLTVAADYETAA